VALASRKTRNRSHARAAHDGPAIDNDVHGALTQALFEGRLAPGSKLPEHRLAAIFGVSRERVRKVLHRLVAERRLERIPRRGTFVPNPSPEEIRTVYRAHRVFESGVLTQLVKELDDAAISRIDAHLSEEREVASRSDRAASVRLSGEFHMLLVDSLKSPELSHFLRELLARSSLMVSAFEPARLSLCSVDEHAAIAEALKARNVERAIALSNEHFTHIEDRLAQGIIERLELKIEDALEPLVSAARAASRKGRKTAGGRRGGALAGAVRSTTGRRPSEKARGRETVSTGRGEEGFPRKPREGGGNSTGARPNS
jgi:DNA-binding GntR family transcriptional regulator